MSRAAVQEAMRSEAVESNKQFRTAVERLCEHFEMVTAMAATENDLLTRMERFAVIDRFFELQRQQAAQR